MGTNLSSPICQITSQVHQFQGKVSIYGASMQGWRNTMEDEFFVVQLFPGVILAGICDGHGGPQVAKYIAKYFPRELLNEPFLKLKNYYKALLNVTKRIDSMLLSERGQQEIMKISKQFRGPKYSTKKSKEIICAQVGSVANIVLITEEKIFMVNVGDCRSVLSRGSQVLALTHDHKPTNTSEKNRILKAGGKVTNGRINNGLNVSRAFGDFKLKSDSKKSASEQLLISIPQIRQITRQKDDNFIIMGCDGIWQRYIQNNKGMVDKVNCLLQKHQNDGKKALDEMLSSFVGKSGEDQLGCDNMTAILIKFD